MSDYEEVFIGNAQLLSSKWYSNELNWEKLGQLFCNVNPDLLEKWKEICKEKGIKVNNFIKIEEDWEHTKTIPQMTEDTISNILISYLLEDGAI